ncbi:copper resistance protein CopA [Moritella sp. Urea-trap-13]|uniref:copper resistance protein CopA n=1 Tax=Moritella sp. Urea-trap-13 TaxID=2058327 RepID=UPI000C34CA28|nr:copper resistance protein CopA [Moritella sp. Urea-trap-13]PKH07465.1 copper resistance protein CopA [Moritella sp. Urea-trap-13]
MLKKMTKTIAGTLVLSAALSLPVFAHDGETHCEDTQLSGVMKEMNDDLKSYVAAFKRSDATAMQAQVTKLIANSMKARNEVPTKLKNHDMPAMNHDMPAMNHDMPAMNHDMPAMNHDMPAMNHDMPAMDHDMAAMNKDMPAMDHSQMDNMPGMDHQTHMQHQGYQQGIEKLTGLFKQLQTADGKKEVKTVLNEIKQHTKKSHKAYRIKCD